jgi:hypothetical protein
MGSYSAHCPLQNTVLRCGFENNYPVFVGHTRYFKRYENVEAYLSVLILTKMFSRCGSSVCAQRILNIAVGLEVCKVILKSVPTLQPL